MQQFRAFGGKMAVNNCGQHLGASKPAAKTNELRKFFIMYLAHRLLHAHLSTIELLAHRAPVPSIGRFSDGFRMRQDGVSDADSFRQTNDPLANLLYARGVLCLDRDKAIRDDRSQKKSDSGTLCKVCS